MRQIRFYGLLFCLSLMATAFATQVEKTTTPQKEIPHQTIQPADAKQMDWVFSGVVSNESGEYYNYFFQLQRDEEQFHTVAALFDAQTNSLVFYDENNEKIDKPELSQWRVGRAFLRFNVINNSWIFGVKSKDKKGFNFKVDMLGLNENNSSKQQDIRAGIELLVYQTGRLNGHLQTGADSSEQFVTARNAWFRQMWVSKPQENIHPLTAILCQFNDGAGFYAVNLKEVDTVRGSIAGWRDKRGMAVPMSQFVTVKESKEGQWMIRIPSPKMVLTFNDLLHAVEAKHNLVAGMVKGKLPGFCAVSLHDIGHLPVKDPG